MYLSDYINVLATALEVRVRVIIISSSIKLITRRLYHRRKHESRIRTSTALIPREIDIRELKQNSQHFS